MARFAFPIALAFILFGSSAIAQQFVPGGNMLTRWDTNNDGRVTLNEIKSGRSAYFDAYDSNRDGALSSAEFDRIARPSNGGRQGNTQRGPAGVLRSQIDRNGDGFISRKEYVDGARLWRDRMDQNGDGVLSSADFNRSKGGNGRGMRWNNG